jgi:hypothetical protein
MTAQCRFSSRPQAGQCVPSDDRVLEPEQKLTNATFGITCAVGKGSLTACIDTWHDHGFVLKPAGSWFF